jgi:hypothetical protein
MKAINDMSVAFIQQEELAIEDRLQLLLDTLEAIKESSAPTFELQLKIMSKIEDLVDKL